jgi:hypothetical protein
MRTKYSYIIFLFAIVCSCNFEREVNLGNDYYLFEDGANTSISKKVPNKLDVYDDIVLGEIIEYSFNDSYIVVYREVTENSKAFFHDHELWTEKNNTPKNQFWIINKASEEVFGPLSFIEYLELKNYKEIEITLEL